MDVARAAPRGNAKTTLRLTLKVLHAIVYGYEPFIVVIGRSLPDAVEKVKEILDELDANDRLRVIYGSLAPKLGQRSGIARWGTRSFVAQNGVKVMAKSRGQSLRGFKHGPYRPTLIILDDIESLDSVLNPEQRLKTRNWFFQDVLKLGAVDGSVNIHVIGTCLHPESLLSELLFSPGWVTSRYRAIIIEAHNQQLWLEFKCLLTDLSNPYREENAMAFFELHRCDMLERASVLWPEGEPYVELVKMRILEGEASFNAEKQNEPYDPTLQIFKMDQAKRFRTVFDETGRLKSLIWLDGSGKVVPSHDITEIIAAHDPALGEKPGSHSNNCFAAIVVVARDRDGYIYCLDAYIEKDLPSEQVERAFCLQRKWGFKTLIVEDNNFQRLLRDIYFYAQERRTDGLTLQVWGVTQHQDKYKRISALEPEITNGHLCFAEDLSPRFINQLTAFPTSYVDGPDALHSAWRQLRHPQARISTTKKVVPG